MPYSSPGLGMCPKTYLGPKGITLQKEPPPSEACQLKNGARKSLNEATEVPFRVLEGGY